MPRYPVLLVVIALLANPIFAQEDSKDPATLGRHFVAQLESENFASAVALFDARMKAALPEPTLRTAWQQTCERMGRLKNIVSANAVQHGGVQVVTVSCQFERGRLNVEIVVNAERAVTGLFFKPYQAPIPPPAPYAKRDGLAESTVTFQASPDHPLPGTLTLPADLRASVPAVVLVHGSGPHDRDETIGGARPFRDLAWGLAQRGIAVLRYDKRTRVHGEKMVKTMATLTVQEEAIDDAVAAARWLRSQPQIDPDRIFVAGHSLGGTVAPRIAKADERLAGLVILAGATRPIEDLILEQNEYLLSLNGPLSKEAAAQLETVRIPVAKIRALTDADRGTSEAHLGLSATYWLDLRANRPAVVAPTVAKPMLILQGERDYQVTLDDFRGWKEALAGRSDVVFKQYPKLNHLFVTGDTRSTPAEYDEIGHVAEVVITDIAAWIHAVKR